jgi:hypothetical protein
MLLTTFTSNEVILTWVNGFPNRFVIAPRWRNIQQICNIRALIAKDDALLSTISENALGFLADRFAHNGKSYKVIKKSIQMPTDVFFDSDDRYSDVNIAEIFIYSLSSAFCLCPWASALTIVSSEWIPPGLESSSSNVMSETACYYTIYPDTI